MKGFFEVMIGEGSVSAITCPSAKCESSALPNQVKELVDPELFEKYERFLLQRTLDQMIDVFKCPRKLCENFVVKDPDIDMACCDDCGFVFCVLCEKSWHGVNNRCEIKSGKYKDICRIYNEGNPGEIKMLYRKYGRAQVDEIVNNMQTFLWLQEHSKPCPTCKAMIQLDTGCNKVQCSVCKGFMCWLCGEKLPMKDPYGHYSRSSGSGCVGKLFEGTIAPEWMIDEFDDHDDAGGNEIHNDDGEDIIFLDQFIPVLE
eukprot:sb/3468522/